MPDEDGGKTANDTMEEFFASLDNVPWYKRKYYWMCRTFNWRSASHWIKLQTVYRWQRSRRGWAAVDTWSLDTYIAGVLAGSIEHLRVNSHGHPPCDDCFSSGVNHDCKGAEKHDAMLTEMAEGFKVWQTHYDLSTEEWEANVKLKKSLQLFSEHFESLWD